MLPEVNIKIRFCDEIILIFDINCHQSKSTKKFSARQVLLWLKEKYGRGNDKCLCLMTPIPDLKKEKNPLK